MIGDKFGHFLDRPLAPIASRIKVAPNVLTLTGFVLALAAALVLTQNLRAGGALILLAAAFDLLDGIVARINERATRFGAFLDSVLDRYADAAIFLALAWHLQERGEPAGAAVSVLTMVGALLISYARARAEGIGERCAAGIMERPERIIFLAFGCLTGWIVPVLWIMLVLTHVTVLQRVISVRKTTGRSL